MTKRTLLALTCLLALGCQSDSTPAAGPAGDGYAPEARESLTSTRKSTGLGAEYRKAEGWQDDTEGDTATFVYIGATGDPDRPKPYPVIYSSDPNNTYLYRENTPQVTVRRLRRDEMARVFTILAREGFETLPWKEHGFRDKIGAERAFYVYRDGRCQRVLKADLSDALKEAFTRVETRMIALNSTY